MSVALQTSIELDTARAESMTLSPHVGMNMERWKETVDQGHFEKPSFGGNLKQCYKWLCPLEARKSESCLSKYARYNPKGTYRSKACGPLSDQVCYVKSGKSFRKSLDEVQDNFK